MSRLQTLPMKTSLPYYFGDLLLPPPSMTTSNSGLYHFSSVTLFKPLFLTPRLSALRPPSSLNPGLDRPPSLCLVDLEEESEEDPSESYPYIELSLDPYSKSD